MPSSHSGSKVHEGVRPVVEPPEDVCRGGHSPLAGDQAGEPVGAEIGSDACAKDGRDENPVLPSGFADPVNDYWSAKSIDCACRQEYRQELRYLP